MLEKIGMRQEGLLRQRVKKWGVFEDVVLMSILREDWVRKEVKAPSSLAPYRRTPKRRGLSRTQKRIV